MAVATTPFGNGRKPGRAGNEQSQTPMKIDAHQHFWIYDPSQYAWMDGDAMAPLRQNKLPADLTGEQMKVGFDGSIVVQARQSLEESRWLLKLAETDERIKGVVGWVDLRAENVADELAEFASHPKFVGVRHVVQDEEDDRFIVGEAFMRGVARLQEFGLTYDILIFPRQLPASIEFARTFPEQPFVLDHIAKPFIKDGVLSPWDEQIRELAALPNVMCKVSGMVTEADWEDWKPGDFKPYLDVVVEAFGEDRLMVGSDWPVCLLAGDYETVMNLETVYFSGFTEEAKAKIFGGNCLKFYGVA